MATTVILTLVGLFLGAASLGMGGSLAGAAIGFLAGQVIRLSGDVKNLARDLLQLKQQQAEFKANPQTTAATVTPASARPVGTGSSSVESGKSFQGAVKAPAASGPTISSQAESAPPVLAATANSVATSTTPVQATSTPASPAQQVGLQPRPQVRPQTPPPSRPQARAFAENPIDKLFAAIGRFFTQGNPIVRVGMVVMFFGLSFLVKYAAGEGLIPLELRLAAVAAIALALVILGWKTRTKEGGYGLVLQGGGIAALYLTVFAALKLYSLLPPGVALVLMLVMVALGAALAILQNAQVLALIATAGGFLSPILTSEGSGSHVALFSFYLLLNLGILTIAWFKTWRTLNWVGFVFTFVITSAWGVLRYEPHLYASTQPFLLAFFALYLLVSVLFSLKQPPKLTGLVDGSLIFGLPIVGFGLQTALLKHTEYGLAISALVLSAVYIALAAFLWRKYQQTHRVLSESFIALGVMFATLAIPLALDAEWTSATWALEAVGLIWVGLRQQRLLPRLAGYLLHLAAAMSLLLREGIGAGTVPVVSGDFISLLILSSSALCIAYLLDRFVASVKPEEKFMGILTLLIGWIWWLVAGFIELEGHLASANLYVAVIVFFSLSCLLMYGVSRKLAWPQLAHTGFWLLPLTAAWVGGSWLVAMVGNSSLHPSKGFGLVALGLFAAIQYGFLRLQSGRPGQQLIRVHHVATAWFFLALIFWDAYWWEDQYDLQASSALMLWFACLVLPLVALMQLTAKPIWPFTQYEREYKDVVPAPLLFLLILWFFSACTHSGATGFTYLPLLNPLDLAQLGAILVLGYAIKCNLVRLGLTTKDMRYGLLGGAGFIWLNIILLRSVHHFGDVVYEAPALWGSPVVQMAISILWSLCALAVMHLSRHQQDRRLWIIGAGLLALVVVKLFTQDLSGSGTLARIGSFMVVGALMLLIGYLAPMPKNPLVNKAEAGSVPQHEPVDESAPVKGLATDEPSQDETAANKKESV